MKRAAWAWGALSLLASACLRLSEQPEPWPCDSNRDCADGKVCRLSRCVPFGTCGDDLECGTGKACLSGRCTAVDCTRQSDQACGAYVCSDDFRCHESCTSSQHCRTGNACSDGACVPATCAADNPEVCGEFACVDGFCATTCESADQCAAGLVCIDGACQRGPKREGEGCSADPECASQLCCPHTASGLPECRAGCERAGLGASCLSDLWCQSTTCRDGVCVACTDPECVALHCAGLECGEHDGASCGTCAERQVCENNLCVDVCQDQECGEDRGVECGKCPDRQRCDVNLECVDACGDRECGYVFDDQVLCGSCPAKFRCSEGQCQDLCLSVECGPSEIDSSVDCGGCDGLNKCVSGQCQPACETVECGYDGEVSCGECGDDLACNAGQCVPEVCPKERAQFCKGDEIWRCFDGVWELFSLDCGPTYYCSESADVDHPVSCLPRCEPDTSYCDADLQFTSCDAEGRPSVERRDCPAEGYDCSSAGCGISDYRQVAKGTCTTVEAQAVGNVYGIGKDVTLRTFGQKFAADPARFFVYEGAAAGGPFTLLAESVEPEPSAQAQPKFADELNVPLKAGFFYVIGVATVDDETGSFCQTGAAQTTLPYGTLLTTGYASASPLPAQIDAPSGPGNTEQTLTVIELK